MPHLNLAERPGCRKEVADEGGMEEEARASKCPMHASNEGRRRVRRRWRLKYDTRWQTRRWLLIVDTVPNASSPSDDELHYGPDCVPERPSCGLSLCVTLDVSRGARNLPISDCELLPRHKSKSHHNLLCLLPWLVVTLTN